MLYMNADKHKVRELILKNYRNMVQKLYSHVFPTSLVSKHLVVATSNLQQRNPFKSEVAGWRKHYLTSTVQIQ